MSTIPITSNNISVPYTIIGGKKRPENPDKYPSLTLLILNRGGRFHRENLLKEIKEPADTEIIYLEDSALSYDIEPLSRKYPDIRFLLLHNEITAGEKINLGAVESNSPSFLVLWSDMSLKAPRFSPSFLEHARINSLLCTVPVLKNTRLESVPCIMIPGYMKKKIKVVPWEPRKNEEHSLYPFDYCGIYDKEKFCRIGGYDPYLKNPYWQKMDFGFRSHLWGEKIQLNTAFHIEYTVETPSEDATPDNSYKLFYLKNIFIKYSGQMAFLPFTRLFLYCLNSDTDFINSSREFFAIRKWVVKNRFKFKMDARTLIQNWEVKE
ncbi:MAG: hypothetical protein JW969_04365 [Spirochaetales bacterium]|nr:hypothetical protein [Spirochaetales bacterium]